MCAPRFIDEPAEDSAPLVCSPLQRSYILTPPPPKNDDFLTWRLSILSTSRVTALQQQLQFVKLLEPDIMLPCSICLLSERPPPWRPPCFTNQISATFSLLSAYFKVAGHTSTIFVSLFSSLRKFHFTLFYVASFIHHFTLLIKKLLVRGRS